MAGGRDIPSLSGADWLAATPTQAVLAALAAGGHEGRVVGGAVRNALMGLPVADVDIATTALPGDVARLARAAGLATVETGLQHGTITVIADHRPFEVTTLRKDVASHGRHATVAFTDDWTADAARRDFTINALYCTAAGTVLDPLGGYPDVVARSVRFIGDAGQRIREDYLRVLRFFRFAAQYAVPTLDADGLSASVRERKGLEILSGERLRQELVRLLAAPAAVRIVTTMQDHGILAEILPVVPRPTLLARVAAIETALGNPPDPFLRLAALGVTTPEEAERTATRLRLSAVERDVLLLAGTPQAPLSEPPADKIAKEMLYRGGPDAYRRSQTLAWARALDASVSDAGWSAALTLPQRWTAPVLPIKGADVLAAGVAPGPRVGQIVRAVELWWIAAEFRPDRAAVLAQIAAAVRET